MKELKVGGSVVYVDARGVQHEALVTAIWGNPESNPCINVVYVSSEEARQDNFGRQIERNSSVVYSSSQPAHGCYYMFPGETPNPVVSHQS